MSRYYRSSCPNLLSRRSALYVTRYGIYDALPTLYVFPAEPTDAPDDICSKLATLYDGWPGAQTPTKRSAKLMAEH